MQFEVPQWLPPAFVRAVQGAGSPLPREDLVAACAAILERWSTPDRVYHGVQHLIDTAAMLETLIPETHEPGLVPPAPRGPGAGAVVGGGDEPGGGEVLQQRLGRSLLDAEGICD